MPNLGTRIVFAEAENPAAPASSARTPRTEISAFAVRLRRRKLTRRLTDWA
jgi:hypothetical protein